jgi:hypothetical protein
VFLFLAQSHFDLIIAQFMVIIVVEGYDHYVILSDLLCKRSMIVIYSEVRCCYERLVIIVMAFVYRHLIKTI